MNSSAMKEAHGISVYYDGLCYLCSMEISHYKRMKGAQDIRFVDITSPLFDAQAEGVDPFFVHKNLHVKDSSGKLFIGVDAFIRIWQEIPAFKKMGRLASVKLVKIFLKTFYFVFAYIRPFLPRRRCSDSPYCSR